MSDLDPLARASASRQPRPEPVRRRGEPFFDDLVGSRYSPLLVRRTLHGMLVEQYQEADRVQTVRVWGGAQAVGNDRYLYGLEQAPRLNAALPGAEFLRPSGSLLYGIADAWVYPMRYGDTADDCPTSAQIDDESQIQRMLAQGRFHDTPTLFDPDPATPRKVVWLLFTGNAVEGGPLTAYLALPGGRLPNRRVDWPHIEPLLPEGWDDLPDDPGEDGGQPATPSPTVPPEPSLNLQLRR